MRRLVVASAILATLLTAPLSLAAAASTPAPSVPPAVTPGPTYTATASDSERATAALSYLLASQLSNGSLDSSLGETADFVIAAAAAGYDPTTLTGCNMGESALDYLAAASDQAVNDAAKTGKVLLAVVAAGQNPAAFEGRNLVTRLAALYHAKTGLYGDGSTFGQAFGILALSASGGTVPLVATDALMALRGSDGSWSYGATAPAAGQGDTNSTAIALMALDAAGVHDADAKALKYLATQQLKDGGFPYQNSNSHGKPVSDVDSDALVVQALEGAEQDAGSDEWSKNGANALTAIRAGQSADGGFAYPGSPESAFTTSQVPAALLGTWYAEASQPKPGASVPATKCANYTPSPTAAPTPAPSPTPTPSPTPSPTAAPTRPAGAIAPGTEGGLGGSVATIVVVIVVLLGLIAAIWGWWTLRARSRKS
jgi:hypothetical protein